MHLCQFLSVEFLQPNDHSSIIICVEYGSPLTLVCFYNIAMHRRSGVRIPESLSTTRGRCTNTWSHGTESKAWNRRAERNHHRSNHCRIQVAHHVHHCSLAKDDTALHKNRQNISESFKNLPESRAAPNTHRTQSHAKVI